MRVADELPPPVIDATSRWAIPLHNASCGAGVVCGGIGERLKAVRMALYVALLSRRARWSRVWRGGAVLQSMLSRDVHCAIRSALWMQRCSVSVCMSCRVVWAVQGYFE